MFHLSLQNKLKLKKKTNSTTEIGAKAYGIRWEELSSHLKYIPQMATVAEFRSFARLVLCNVCIESE
jgi:hypothetical protein